jgi:Tol biopolymer transport system component
LLAVSLHGRLRLESVRISFALLAALSFALATSAVGATQTTYRAAIYAVRDDGTDRRLIAQPEPPVPYLIRSPGGHSILYTREIDGVWALFASERSGANPVRLTPPNLPADTYPSGAFSPDGRNIAFTNIVGCRDRYCDSSVYVVRRDGSGLRLLAADAASPSWAPDSRRLVYAGSRGLGRLFRSIYVTDVERNGRRLVAQGTVERPTWAPHGERIAYWANRRGYGVACFVNADGSRRRCTRGHSLTSLVWSRDGKFVAFRQATPRKLGFVDSDARRVRSLGYHGRWAHPAAWSPDGRRLAFHADSGSVHVLRIDRPKQSVIVIPEDAFDVRWRGREISYVVTRRESP